MLSLSNLRGEVHRFEARVSAFGVRKDAKGAILHTICVDELRHVRTGEDVTPDHCWFDLRKAWLQLSPLPGDTVLFEAKVQRQFKGKGRKQRTGSDRWTPEDRVPRFGAEPRELVLIRRSNRLIERVIDMREEIAALKMELGYELPYKVQPLIGAVDITERRASRVHSGRQAI